MFPILWIFPRLRLCASMQQRNFGLLGRHAGPRGDQAGAPGPLHPMEGPLTQQAPDLQETPARQAKPLLDVDRLVKHFGGRQRWLAPQQPVIRAIDGVSFSVARGEVVGLVGESGSGKTTIGRTVLRLTDPTAGRIEFDGEDITTLGRSALQPYRRRMQIVFQDPFASLNPRLRIGSALAEALTIHDLWNGRRCQDRIVEILERVGLSAQHMQRYPHEFSGGQRQPIVIARALAVEPDLIVADEPVSALDVSIQAQIINLLARLQREIELAMLSSP